MARSQGAQANLTGNRLEKFIEFSLIDSGYQKAPDKNEFVERLETYNHPAYSTQTKIGHTIYETNLICDFLLYHPQKWPHGLVLEAKWQQVSGTADEKYPYFVMNIWKSEYQTVMILDGGGYRAGAERWVRAMQKRNLLHVFSMSQFQTWVNQGNL